MAETPIVSLYRTLTRELEPLQETILRDVPAVEAIYNPLVYAGRSWQEYLNRYGTGRREVLFLGMNPGPWGMAQTGVPFGEVAAVRDWMGLEMPVDSPPVQHPARPVRGFACTRSEVSGRRLWALMARRYQTASAFFQNHLVLNYCPLVFMGERGRNLTPDRLPKEIRQQLERLCDAALAGSISVLAPRFVVGVGAFARRCLERVLRENATSLPEQPLVVQILHPSPASPAANKSWEETVINQLTTPGVWGP